MKNSVNSVARPSASKSITNTLANFVRTEASLL